MLNMQPAAMRDTLEQLAQATHDHLEWHANLLRVIVCELPSDPNDLAASAHRQCRLGRWYYRHAPVELQNQPGFAAIGIEHQRVHQVAAGILRDVAEGRPIERQAFDELLASSLRLRRELDLLRGELQSALRSRDVLTGAHDRDQALPELRRWRVPVSRGATSCCIVFMDLDRLKEINDRHGHPIGDALLADAVRLLREHLRADDRVFRYGGDEFLISLPAADLAIGQSVVARIRDGFARRQLFIAGAGSAFHVTASFGLALLDPEIRVEDSVDRAAQALLLAKTAGGDRAISWDPSVTTGRHLRRLRADESPHSVGADVADQRSSEGSDDEGRY
jgi:diguanylate cyclase (GGDEF)-like protein